MFGDEGQSLKLEDVQLHDFGEAEEVTITKDDTLILRVCCACNNNNNNNVN